jgi:hypothetical protein
MSLFKRSRSPQHMQSKEKMLEELGTAMNGICKELHIENFEDCIKRIKDMKESIRKVRKEKKLIINLQHIAKDCPIQMMKSSSNISSKNKQESLNANNATIKT